MPAWLHTSWVHELMRPVSSRVAVTSAVIAGPTLTVAEGWELPSQYTTLRLADIERHLEGPRAEEPYLGDFAVLTTGGTLSFAFGSVESPHVVILMNTILSGIAQHYSPEEMVGKQVTFIANLAPRKMMGIMSQGMILMAVSKPLFARKMPCDCAAVSGAPLSIGAWPNDFAA